MENSAILKDYSDQEKGAYLGAIASLATADHAATDEEIAFITELADSAGISEAQKKMVLQAASEMSGDELERCIEILKSSELRFSLITDLISFAKSDGDYSEREKSTIENIAQQLGVNKKQFSLLDHFVAKSNDEGPAPQTSGSKGFFDSLGLGDKLKAEGINASALGKGLLAIAAPLLLARLMRGRVGRMGGLTSGLGGFGAMGGIGSIISALSMGRGFGSTGGLLSRFLRRRV